MSGEDITSDMMTQTDIVLPRGRDADEEVRAQLYVRRRCSPSFTIELAKAISSLASTGSVDPEEELLAHCD